MAQRLAPLSPIDSAESFNRYARAACEVWREQFPEGIGETEQFPHLLAQVEGGSTNVIRTSWGGVVITRHEPPHVEKYLVLRGGSYLALEMHAEKDERLEVQEGAGLILWRAASAQFLTVQPLLPGNRFHFEPGIEHCIIGTEDLLVLERSTDPKGMDQDLIFIYEPAATPRPTTI